MTGTECRFKAWYSKQIHLQKSINFSWRVARHPVEQHCRQPLLQYDGDPFFLLDNFFFIGDPFDQVVNFFPLILASVAGKG